MLLSGQLLQWMLWSTFSSLLLCFCLQSSISEVHIPVEMSFGPAKDAQSLIQTCSSNIQRITHNSMSTGLSIHTWSPFPWKHSSSKTWAEHNGCQSCWGPVCLSLLTAAQIKSMVNQLGTRQDTSHLQDNLYGNKASSSCLTPSPNKNFKVKSLDIMKHLSYL